MDLPSTLGAPRICWLGGKVYWIRPIDLEGFAILLAWLDDVLPGREERTMPPLLSSPEAQERLAQTDGQVIIVWLALRHEGMTFAQALDLPVSPLERSRLEHVLFSRRRTRTDSPGGRDIAETWCGEGLASLAAQIGIERIRALTLDQHDWLASDGNVDSHASPSAIGRRKAWEQWEASQVRFKANGETTVTNG